MGPLGPLERQVLDALWTQGGAACVRGLRTKYFPGIAYTTLMTTLDRLYRKGIVNRAKQGRAFFYTPRMTLAEVDSAIAAEALSRALACDSSSLRPLLSSFVNAMGNRDKQLLDELEDLVRARRLSSI
jgi:predicted transcriptional regulator